MSYQVKTTKDLKSWVDTVQLSHPYTIIEFREDFDKHYKFLAVAAQKQGWKNASDIKFNFIQKIYYRNLTVKQFLEHNQINKESIEVFLEKYHTLIEISLAGNDRFLSLAENKRAIINFFVLSNFHHKIVINTGWYYLPHFFAINGIIDEFIDNGGQCIRITTIHHDKISEAFQEYRANLKTDKSNIQLFYFTDIPLYWLENQ